MPDRRERGASAAIMSDFSFSFAFADTLPVRKCFTFLGTLIGRVFESWKKIAFFDFSVVS